MTTNQEAIRRLFNVMVDNSGNLPSMPGVYPDYPAPIVRNSGASRELTTARWGMPTPPKFLEGRKSDPGVTNIRNPMSPHWRRWLNIESRCLVPFKASTHDLLKIVRLALPRPKQTQNFAHSKHQLPFGTVLEQVYESQNRPETRGHVTSFKNERL